MEYFINKIIQANGSDLSSSVFVHNRFVRFSKGEFEGPALKATRKGKTVTIKATVDYENLLGFLAIEFMQGNVISLDGTFTAFEDPSNTIAACIPAGKREFVSVDAKKSTWIVNITGNWNKEEAIAIYEAFNNVRGYILLKVSSDNDKVTSFTVKTKPPQNKGDFDFENAIKFSTLKLPNDGQSLSAILELIVPDVAREANQFKELVVRNSYKVDDIIIPKDTKDGKDKRLSAQRKGTITRKIEVDGKKIMMQVPFLA